MKKLLDFSATRPGGASIKEVADGVIRYLSHSAWKNLTKDEVDDYRKNGLEIGVVWETTSDRCLSGFKGGKEDATTARLMCLDLLGEIIPIYFAVDFNITDGQLSTLDEYLSGAESVLGKYLIGVYGSYLAIEHCFAKNSATWFWQTLAWSAKKISIHNHIYQDGKAPPISGTDTNIASDEWGFRIPKTDSLEEYLDRSLPPVEAYNEPVSPDEPDYHELIEPRKQLIQAINDIISLISQWLKKLFR